MYASRTGTYTTLDRLQAHGWRILMSVVGRVVLQLEEGSA